MRKTGIIAALLAGVSLSLGACAVPAVTGAPPPLPATVPVTPPAAEVAVMPEPACPTEPTAVKLGPGPWSYVPDPVKYVFEVTPASGQGGYSISQLQVYPIEAAVGDNVTFSIFVSNTGAQPGTYTVALQFDGTVIQTQDVTITGGDSIKVEFGSMATYGEFKVVAGELTAGLKVVF